MKLIGDTRYKYLKTENYILIHIYKLYIIYIAKINNLR